MKILIDMNLSPAWVDKINSCSGEITALHWIKVGDPSAPDSDIFEWARSNEYIIFTHDLDFGVLLANSNSKGPSVIQFRSQNTDPETYFELFCRIIIEHKMAIEEGALVTINESRTRIRILPLRRDFGTL